MLLPEFKIIKVPKKIYNTIRSFVESSYKLKYLHNQPYVVTQRSIVFEKDGRWRLIINFAEEKIYLRNDRFETIITADFVPYAVCDFTIPSVNAKFSSRERGQIEPTEPVNFAVPINSNEVLSKLRHYLYLAEHYISLVKHSPSS